MSEAQVNAIDDYENSDHFDDKQRTVMRFAEQVTKNVRADDATVQSLKEFLSDSQIVVLIGSIGLANFTNRFNEALGVELP